MNQWLHSRKPSTRIVRLYWLRERQRIERGAQRRLLFGHGSNRQDGKPLLPATLCLCNNLLIYRRDLAALMKSELAEFNRFGMESKSRGFDIHW